MKHMRKLFVLMIVMAAISAPAFANLVTNGNFETGDLTGWTQWTATWGGPYGGATVVQSAVKNSGTYALSLGGPSGSWGVYQLINTTPGTPYMLTGSWKVSGDQDWVEVQLANGSDALAGEFATAADRITARVVSPAFGGPTPDPQPFDWQAIPGSGFWDPMSSNILVATGSTMSVSLKAGRTGGSVQAYFDDISVVAVDGATTGTIAGRITDSVTAGNIAGAVVTLDASGTSATTAADGTYTFSYVSSGKHTISVVKSGYYNGQASVVVSVSATANGDLAIVLVPAAPHTWNAANDFSSTLNPNGSWTFGSWSGLAIDRIYNGRSTQWIQGDWTNVAGWFVVGAGDQHWNPGGLCKSNGTFAPNMAGAPVGRMITQSNAAAMWTAPRAGTINISGDFFNVRSGGSVQLVVKGNILVNTPLGGRGVNNPYPFTEGTSAASLENISVAQGDTVVALISGDYLGFDLTISEGAIPGGSIAGKITDSVTGNGIDGATVILDGTTTATTATDGTYTFSDVTVGAHSISVTKSGYYPGSASMNVQSATVSNGDIAIVALAAAPHMWDAASDFSSSVNSNGSWSYGYWSDATGFNLYDAHTTDWIGSDWTTVPGWFKAGGGDQQWNPGGLCRSNGTFKANPSASPAGTMAKYGNAAVRWTAPRACTVNVFGDAFNVRSMGSFMLFQNDATVLIDVPVLGNRPATNPYNLTEGVADPSALRNIVMNEGDTLTLWLSGDYIGFDFLIGDAGDATIIGKVTDYSTGAGISGATVALEGTSFSATTASDGTYAITDVPSDNYTFIVSKAGYISKSFSLIVPAGDFVKDAQLLSATSISIAEAKTKSTGWTGNIVGIVSAGFTDYNTFYLESSDRTGGVKVAPMPESLPAVGSEVTVFAVKQADGSFQQTNVSPTGNTVNLTALGSANKNLIPAGGLSNELLLVRAWGKVLDDPYTATDGTKIFHIGDGSSSPASGSVFVAGGTSNALFTDNFDGTTKDAAWIDAMGTTTTASGKLVSVGPTNEVVVGGLNILEPTISVDINGAVQAAFLARFKDTNSFLLAFYSPVQNTVAFHEKVNGNWGGWLNPVWNAAFNKTGNVHMTLQIVGNQATFMVSDGTTSIISTTPLATLHSPGLVGLYHDTGNTGTQYFDNFTLTAPVPVHSVAADVIEVVIPPSVTGTPSIAKDDYVAASGILTRGVPVAGNQIRTVVIRDAVDLTPNP